MLVFACACCPMQAAVRLHPYACRRNTQPLLELGLTLPGSGSKRIANPLTNIATGTREDFLEQLGLSRMSQRGWRPFHRDATAAGFLSSSIRISTVNTRHTLKEDISLTVGNAAHTVHRVERNALQVQSETIELSTLIPGQQSPNWQLMAAMVTAPCGPLV